MRNNNNIQLLLLGIHLKGHIRIERAIKVLLIESYTGNHWFNILV
jgi:hypothetical protein